MPTSELNLPLLALRDVVIYPYMVIPLFVGRKDSIHALEAAMENDKHVFLVAQKDPKLEAPKRNDLYNTGTIATILQLLKMPDGTVKVLVEGLERANFKKLIHKDNYLTADVEILDRWEDAVTPEIKALMRAVLVQFDQLIKATKRIPSEVLTALANIEDPGRLVDSVAAHLTLKIEVRQKILESFEITDRLELLHNLLAEELSLVELDKRVQDRVKEQVDKNQRQYYLGEKIKAIQKEMGELDEKSGLDETQQLQKKIEEAGMSVEAKEKALAELNKLKMMPPMSAEATVCRNYLDWLVGVPWKKRSKVSTDLAKAESILDSDHFGLEKVKERILEYLAVGQRVKKSKGPILCLVGPPGVGKTSLGQSIANATGRNFTRISLGGVRDEAEIRGHRRTYVGAMPGKIIQKLAKAKVRNPLFMLDEVDKMAMDFRGDPAAALLEVLDPEQNSTFSDHYLEVDYDLSDVMFIATANSLDIPPALLDRMEIIRIAGYTETEKLNIATRYLVPRQIEAAGLKKSEIKIPDEVLLNIIRCYTREAGVRSLDREISKLCRKAVKEILLNKKVKAVKITNDNLESYLGVKRYRYGLAESHDQIGQVTGLAWTEVGGELLTIEVQVVPGKGEYQRTGSLGDVMKESIQAALTVARSRYQMLGLSEDFYQKHDYHFHVPEGATPKDGPSAGIAMCTALVSALTKIPVKADVAMTGEITLRGEVLPIGGLKEKLLAAMRGGIKTVVIPEENVRDLKEIPKEVKDSLKICPVKWIDQVLEIALQHKPQPLLELNIKPTTQKSGAKAKEGSVRTH
ncbi:MAG TPA: endopeptidase La [Coxiellaceae bacterium]|nr:endopeptidase La [Coxiellaceae bacterium]